jgi:hypothetical protein
VSRVLVEPSEILGVDPTSISSELSGRISREVRELTDDVIRLLQEHALPIAAASIANVVVQLVRQGMSLDSFVDSVDESLDFAATQPRDARVFPPHSPGCGCEADAGSAVHRPIADWWLLSFHAPRADGSAGPWIGSVFVRSPNQSFHAAVASARVSGLVAADAHIGGSALPDGSSIPVEYELRLLDKEGLREAAARLGLPLTSQITLT